MSNEEKQVATQEKQVSQTRDLERTRSRAVFAPDVDIRETRDELIVYADIPGVPEDKVEVTLEKGVLTIRGEVPVDRKDGKYSRILGEYATGDYERAFTLSDEVDQEKIRATVKDGVLTLHLPKAAPAKARKIQVAAE